MGSGRLSVRLDDISKLEINSMLVDGIWGRKMPHPAAALCEIICAWVYQFNVIMARLNSPSPEKIFHRPEGDRPGGEESGDEDEIKERAFLSAVQEWQDRKAKIFDGFVKCESTVSEFTGHEMVKPVLKHLLDEKAMNRLRAKLRKFIHKKDADYCNGELFRLLRLQTRIGCLKDVYADANDEPDFRDRQELRKLWELKDGYIFAQHTIQVDGDVISRINARMYRDKLAQQFKSELLAFHHRNVEVGLSNWQFLVETLVALAKSVVSGIFSWASSKFTGALKVS